jgi:alkylation response protein AidB-like acyl-CoA dehydrogenase
MGKAALFPHILDDPKSDVIALMDKLTTRALGGHIQETSLQGDIDLLHAHGWLFACAPTAAGGIGLSYESASLDIAIDFLFRLGCANLALGRLFEGHVNACKLVHMLATPAQAQTMWDRIANGAFLGVWGADGHLPVTLEKRLGTHYLTGAKAFCSGLGSVSLAIVSAQTPTGLQLIIAEVTDPARGDASQWQSSGMQATRSGTFDFRGLLASDFELLGAPDAYYEEPHFLGGQWRYLALHAGCVCAIAQAISAHLNALNRQPSETELMRLARIVALSKQAKLWATSIAQDTEISGNAAASIQAVIGREQVEHACLEAISVAERTVGTRAFTLGTRLEQLCRDLRTYLRQAALDQRLLEAGQKLLALSPTGQSFMENSGASPVSAA